MTAEATNEILNRLLVIHHRSLATYLRDAPPWMGSNHQADAAREVLAAIASENARMVDELAELLLDRNWVLQYGEYPLSFTAYHDLSFEFVLSQLIEQQRRDILRIEQCVAQLQDDPLGRAIAERALGAAKAHLENLTSLKKPQPATKV